MTRSLGLDVGDRWIGVALSDPQGILASPFTVMECRDETVAVAAIVEIVRENQVEQVIVGLPFSMSGRLGKQAEKVQAFTRRLRERSQVPIEFRDERLSTVEARRLMQATKGKKKREKARDDAIAAAIILQGYLDERLADN